MRRHGRQLVSREFFFLRYVFGVRKIVVLGARFFAESATDAQSAVIEDGLSHGDPFLERDLTSWLDGSLKCHRGGSRSQTTVGKIYNL